MSSPRFNYKFPELSATENAAINKARDLGWAEFFPAFPSAKAQADRTLAGALVFLAGNSPPYPPSK